MNKKIAVPIDTNGILDEHFGHCKYFVVFEIIEGKIVSEQKFIPPPHEPGVIPKWLSEINVTDIIAGGIGNKAIQIFNQSRVNVFAGAPQFTARRLVEGYLNNSIVYSANYCDH